MKKNIFLIIGSILMVFMFSSSPYLYARNVGGHGEEVEYAGENSADTIRVSKAAGGHGGAGATPQTVSAPPQGSVSGQGTRAANAEGAPKATHGNPAGPGTEAAGGHGKGAEHVKVAVKAVQVTLADGQTMTILRTDWLKVAAEANLSADKARLSGFFWTFMAILAGLTLLGLILFAGGTFKRFGLNLKLYTSFGGLVLLAMILGAGAYYYISNLTTTTHLEGVFLGLDKMSSEMQVAQDEFLLHGIENFEYGEKQVAKVKGLVEKFKEDIEGVEKGGLLDAEQARGVREIQTLVNDYDKDFEEVAKAYHGIEKAKEELDELGEKVNETIEELTAHHAAELERLEAEGVDLQGIAYQTRMVERLMAAEIHALKVSHGEVEFLLDKKVEHVEAMAGEMGLFLGYIKALEEEAESSEEKARLKEVEKEMKEYASLLKEVIREEALIEKDTSEMVEFVHRIEAIGASLSHQAEMRAVGMEREADIALIVLILMALVTGTLLSIFVARAISVPVKRIIEGLNEGAEQVASASGQVSTASQSLAEGSSEQAASIEETSSSLEEISSMTKQNADNATQADNLMKEANQVVGQANDSMSELITSMEEISKASEETSKIIKTIDEIAFQTNLLALNAAVEAARAGEAGAGFAVVADEVRNLAMRAADAAKNTADLIEGTVKRVKDGSELVTRTNEAFTKVAESSSKVGELVGEIAAASNEQSLGIDQVNKAMTEMDKVVQQNAANAEESASASEEMNAQAEQMKGNVDDLVALVSGDRGNVGFGHNGEIGRRETPGARAGTGTRMALAAPPKEAKGKEAAVRNTKEVRPHEVIPIEDKDFRDF